MKLALVQHAVSPDLGRNLDRALRTVREAAAAGAQLVAFPELANTPFYPQERRPRPELLAEPVPGPTTERFCEVAAECGVVIVLNLFERDGDACYDSSPVIDADGTLLGRTRMVHITDYDCYHERHYYTPGDTGAPVYQTRAGRIGVAICYDRHFPEYMRALALGGAELIVVPQAGTVGEWPEGLFEAEMRVAAFQNGYFVALANRVGHEERMTFAGRSFVCAPDGSMVGQAGAGDEVFYAEVHLPQTRDSHARRLFLADRRPGLYAGFLGR
ncbi:nitrilase-related carbon-nitrogen hydrolase [Mycobacterium spongiae]|uniref:Carbon-nitrogen hydrolase family protein n=1 Tax=Mycobacterium spongiae TaxID=886343 RepID=A0A975K079_9MYCO|nr:nitrilase-related carbon-nitrogen hydrolase [Mycobacterium spongiae]QUR68284.1 carbon-nitrogen hydrolase family protein [Mycobacterium spongiae]